MKEHTIRLDQNGNKTVIFDYVMGTGKTTLAINLINQNPQHKYLFITPFLSEIERVKANCKGFYSPTVAHGKGRKQNSFFKLLKQDSNIACTHSLFQNIDINNPDIDLLKDYNLFIDEVVDVIEVINEKPNDVEMLLRDRVINVGTDNIVSVIKEDYEGRHEDTLNRIRSGNVRLFGGNTLVWLFPSKILEAANSVIILTYLFEGSKMHSYLRINKIGFNINYRGLIGDEEDKPTPKPIRDLITIYEGKHNAIGSKRKGSIALTKSWYEKARKEQLKKLGNNIRNVARHYKIKSDYLALTTFKDYAPVIESKDKVIKNKNTFVPWGYRTGTFISLGTRATNDYSHKKLMMYLIDKRMNPVLKQFIESHHGITADEELYSLSDLIQWLWRGCIRNNEQMMVYIPSKRMRTLLKDWLNNKKIGFNT